MKAKMLNKIKNSANTRRVWSGLLRIRPIEPKISVKIPGPDFRLLLGVGRLVANLDKVNVDKLSHRANESLKNKGKSQYF